MSRVVLPVCKHRKRVDGVDMCQAIGCCEVSDMACECEACLKEHGYVCRRQEFRGED